MTNKEKTVLRRVFKKALVDLTLVAAITVVIILSEVILALVMSVTGVSQWSSLALIAFLVLAFAGLVYCEYKDVLRDYKHIEHERIWGHHL